MITQTDKLPILVNINIKHELDKQYYLSFNISEYLDITRFVDFHCTYTFDIIAFAHLAIQCYCFDF